MADIVLKDPLGRDQNPYTGKSKLRVTNAEGEKVIFSEGEAVENIPIALDFSNGDQTVTAPEGTLVKSAIIYKPETLTPENVADGVNIAGVIGTHSGGGSGGSGWPDVPNDGKTRIFVRQNAEVDVLVNMHIQQSISNGVTIDWGDGSPTETVAGTGAVKIQHTFPPGNHIVSFEPMDECSLGLGNGNYDAVFAGTANVVLIKKVIFGKNVTTCEKYGFYMASALEEIVLTNTIVSIEERAFSLCYGISLYDFSKFTHIPTIGTQALQTKPAMRIKVPASMLEEWKTAENWSTYADYIVGV